MKIYLFGYICNSFEKLHNSLAELPEKFKISEHFLHSFLVIWDDLVPSEIL